MIPCNICNSTTSKIFAKNSLNKDQVSYYQCEVCKFIQTEKRYWLQEVYSSAITNKKLLV